MRRLSIRFTCLLALLPALMLGCKAYEAPDSAYVGSRSDAKVSSPSDGAYAYAEEPGGYDHDYGYADDMVAAEAEEAAPAPAASPAPSGGGVEAIGDGVGAASAGAAGSGGRDRSAGTKKGKAAKSSSSSREGSPARIARDEADKSAKIAKERRDQHIQSGTLTAGSFDDNLNPWVFDKFMGEVRQHSAVAQLASVFGGPRTVVRVQDGRGRPLANAKVTIDGKPLMTRSDGRVVWVQNWDGGAQGQGKATIEHGNSRKSISIKDQVEQIVTLADSQATLPTRLDIALVIDATGSMGDELEYLKVEIRDIAAAIHKHFPNVDQRFALIVYRDIGDQYVTRVFDFTGDLGKFQRDLKAQSAAGGGDYPEAMDAALQAANELSWRKGDTARVTFLVADAPPHSHKVTDTFKAVDDLRSKGVAIYPVASSGVAGEAEFVMRTAAMLTGAQYLFLTDDSGVGNPHAEPHIPCYTVEQLAPLMVRAVRSELSGQRVEAEPQFAIRTVGKGQAGVCEKPRATAKIAK